jgi:hypothetical protein
MKLLHRIQRSGTSKIRIDPSSPLRPATIVAPPRQPALVGGGPVGIAAGAAHAGGEPAPVSFAK